MPGQRLVMGCYILDEAHQPVQTDLATWAMWMHSHLEQVVIGRHQVGRMHVSTVFTGQSALSLMRREPLQIFETMIFHAEDTRLAGYQRRYDTYAEAVQGHAMAVMLARSLLHLPFMEPPSAS